jgi:N-acetylglucosaminyldiphosphoundecaprenol N-acetyl-beta-D-mannosaminyltransferase
VESKMDLNIPDALSILGVSVDLFDTYEQVMNLIHGRITSQLPTFCVAINPEKIYRAGLDMQLKAALDGSHIRICDGIGVSLASLLLHRRPLKRCTGIDLFLSLVQFAAGHGLGVFILGASQQVNETACRILEQRYRSLKILGHQHGYFDDPAAVVNDINKSGADLLFVAMGSPRQEHWIHQHMSVLRPKFCMGIGGSLDVVSGAKARAPLIFQKTGTEWLSRLMTQPYRCRRQLALPMFGFDVLLDLLKTRAARRSQVSLGRRTPLPNAATSNLSS